MPRSQCLREEVDAIAEALNKNSKTLLKTAIIGRSQKIIDHIDRLSRWEQIYVEELGAASHYAT
jgi:hypothetical protein